MWNDDNEFEFADALVRITVFFLFGENFWHVVDSVETLSDSELEGCFRPATTGMIYLYADI